MSFKPNERVYYYKDLAGVYLVKDLTNGKQYVGSSKHLDKRMRDYEKGVNISPHLVGSIYIVGVVEFCSDENILQKELEYIRLYGSEYYKGFGYNKRCPVTKKNLENIDKEQPKEKLWKHGNTGKNHNNTTKIKISNSKIRPLIIDGVYYESINYAAEVLGVTRATISRRFIKTNSK